MDRRLSIDRLAVLAFVGMGCLLFPGWIRLSQDVAQGQDLAAVSSPEGDRNFSRQEAEWLEFRGTFPFHMQSIAVSAAYPAGTRTLIVSEPPPHVTIDGLVAVDESSLSHHRIKQWTIGFDGWVKDVVVQLPPMKETDLDELIGKLNKFLFDTDYKHFALRLPIDRRETETKYPLDVQVHTADLEGWYKDGEFLPLGKSNRRQLAGAPVGVYLSTEPGLVVWIIPKDGLERRRADARKFALDSDLILGAVSRGDAIAIFGRERVVPLAVLPPLRTEMIVALAAAKDDSLSQSYERKAFAAGASHARWDWAPIYLSPELLDTEYGSVLNMTDQMLKGWSLNGRVEYYNFPAEAPSRMPFDAPLIRQLHATELLFNWNTTGFGLITRSAVGSIYSTTRTGALPVTYRPEHAEPGSFDVFALFGGGMLKATKNAEDRAYSYYATLNEPLLARAVQYASLYQLFTAFDVTTGSTPHRPQWNQSKALKGVAATVLKSLRESSEDDIRRAARSVRDDLMMRMKISRQARSHRQNRSTTAALGKVLAAELGIASGETDYADADAIEDATIEALTALRGSYAEFYDVYGDEGEAFIATRLGAARDFDPSLLRGREDMLSDAQGVLLLLRASRLPVRLCDVRKLQQAFSESRSESGNRWLRTPTVVYSRSLGELATATGGHNIDATTTRVIRSGEQPRGTVRIPDNRQVIVCHPADAHVVERHARLIARSEDAQNLKARLEGILREARGESPRNRWDVLSRAAEYKPSRRGFSPEEHVLSSLEGKAVPPTGGGGAGKPPVPPGTLPGAEPPPNEGNLGHFQPGDAEILYVSQKDGRSTIRREIERDGKAETVATDVWNQRDLIYALRGEFEAGGRTLDRNPLRIVFDESISAENARRIMDGLSLHASLPRSDRLTVVYRATRNAMPAFRSPVTKASVVAGSIDVAQQARKGIAGSKIQGRITATTGSGDAEVSFDVFLANVAPQLPAVEESVGRSVQAVQSRGGKLQELPPEVYERLLKDLKAVKEGSSGQFRLTGLGDVFITEFEHRGRELGAIVLVRK